MTEKQLTSSLEDYIEVISNHIKQHQKVRAVDISKELGVTRASVSEALKRLAEIGLIKYSRYDVIAITEKGEQVAKKIIDKHKLLEDFFCTALGLDKTEAAENACRIEHVITEKVYNRLADYVRFSQKNPDFNKEFLKTIKE